MLNVVKISYCFLNFYHISNLKPTLPWYQKTNTRNLIALQIQFSRRTFMHVFFYIYNTANACTNIAYQGP